MTYASPNPAKNHRARSSANKGAKRPTAAHGAASPSRLRVGAHGSLSERAAERIAKSTSGPAAPESPLFHSSVSPDKLGSTPLAPSTSRQVHSVTSRSGQEKQNKAFERFK